MYGEEVRVSDVNTVMMTTVKVIEEYKRLV